MVESHVSHFLDLPREILLRILDYLYINQEIYIEHFLPREPGYEPSTQVERDPFDTQAPMDHMFDDEVSMGHRYSVRTNGSLWFRMKNKPLGAQLIRTCRQLHRESHHLLYANNTFNCSQREGLKLLLQNIGPKNFATIKHIIIDWEQLQDFAWSLAKEDYNSAMSGLETVELATWRMRVMGGSSPFFREIKSYERQLCQSALDICEKHKKLKVVAQRPFHHKSGRPGGSHRVKWRFLTSEADMKSDESIVPVKEELTQLKASGDSEAGGSGAQQMIDPF